MPIGDLVRYIVIALVLLVLGTFGLKVWNKQKLQDRIVKDLRSLTNQTASFEARNSTVARSALFRTMGLLHEAKKELDIEPAEVLTEVFHGDDEGALFGRKETGPNAYSDPKADIIRKGLLRNYTHCTNLGLFSDSENLKMLAEGKPPSISNGEAAGANAVVGYIVEPEIAAGIESIIPNMVISSPAARNEQDAPPTEFEITRAKELIRDLYRARLIDRDAEDRLSLHYERFNAPPDPAPPSEPAPEGPETPGPEPEPGPEAKQPPPVEDDCPFDTPLE